MEHGREDKNPWSKWYWQDWEADTGLRACGLKAQGLWMRMLSIMARSQKKGYLLDGEKQMESKTLAKLTGETDAEIKSLIAELFAHGVPSKDQCGTIFNRRMIREKSISDIRSESGRLGGRPKKQRKANQKNTKAPSVYVSASASASLKSSDPIAAEFEAGFWAVYPVQLGKQDALEAYRELREKCAESEIEKAYLGYIKHLKDERINHRFEKSPMYPAKFLTADRWREYVGIEYRPKL